MTENRATDEQCEELLRYVFGFLDELQTRIAPEAYDPITAVAGQLEKEQKKAEIKKLQQELDEEYEQMKENTLYKSPPMIVKAYWNVFKRWPEGWVQE